MLSTAFLNKSGWQGASVVSYFMDPRETILDGALTLPRLSQLATVLPNSVDFSSLSRVRRYSSKHLLESSSELISVIQTVPDDALMVVSMMKSEDVSRVYAVFSPKPKLDGASVQTNAIPNHVGRERCAIFQLLPAFDIYRGVVGKPGWTVLSDDAVVFGRKGGMMMTLNQGLVAQRGTFSQM
jgi:hypothetical protein